MKILLPHNLTASHHLLFTFSHIAIEAAKGGKREVPVETVVGYSWLPLTHKGRLVIDEQLLPVAAHLPAKYLSIEPLGLGKGVSLCFPQVIRTNKSQFRSCFDFMLVVVAQNSIV